MGATEEAKEAHEKADKMYGEINHVPSLMFYELRAIRKQMKADAENNKPTVINQSFSGGGAVGPDYYH